MSNLFSDSEPQQSPPRFSRKIIYLLPLSVILGTLAVFIYSAKDSLMSYTSVDISRVRMSAMQRTVAKGRPIFQAAGWVHADPYPTQITALTSGIVEELHVVEGETILKDQLLVTLDRTDLRLELKKKRSQLMQLELLVTQKGLDKKQLQNMIQEKKQHKKTQEIIGEAAYKKWQRYKKSGLGVSGLIKEQAEYEYLEKKSLILETDHKIEVLKAEVIKESNLEKVAQVDVYSKKIDIESTELNLKRCLVRSPIAGILQKVYARIGRKQMLGSDNPLSTTVAEIFDPKKILIKADVPLGEVKNVYLSQKVKISIDALSSPLYGSVSQMSGEADYQKNTLEVRVKIKGGHPDLRPKMLAQVEFLSKESTGMKKTKTRVWIDPRCVDSKGRVYIVNFDNRIEMRQIKLENDTKEGWHLVLNGLKPGEKAVVNPQSNLTQNMLVKIGTQYE